MSIKNIKLGQFETSGGYVKLDEDYLIFAMTSDIEDSSFAIERSEVEGFYNWLGSALSTTKPVIVAVTPPRKRKA